MSAETLEKLLEQQNQMEQQLIKIQKRTQTLSEPSKMSHDRESEPIYDLYRLGKILHIELEMPGVLEKDLSVELTPDYLKVTSTIAELENVEEAHFLIRQRQRGKFEYLFHLPNKHWSTLVPPELKNGILTLQLQETSPAKDK